MKRTTSLLASCFLLAVLAACGGGSSSAIPSNNPGSSNSAGSPLPAGTELLYIGDNAGVIHGFAVDPNSGNLTALSSVAVTKAGAGDVGLLADLGGLVLYATNAGIGGPNVVSFKVNRTTGALTPITGGAALPVPPRGLAVAGGSLYVIPDPGANAAQLFAFSIDVNGALALLSPTVTLPGPAHDLGTVEFGKNLPSWMGLTFDGTSGGEIQGIVVQPHGGATGLQLDSPDSSGGNSPRSIRVTPDSQFVVVANQGTSTVSAFSLDSSTGALAAVPGSPFASGNAPGPVAIYPPPTASTCCPSGKFVFVGNTGENSLSAYTIDSSGSLTAVTGSPIPLGTNAQPSSIALDPGGKFVYVGIAQQEVAGFALDPSTGALTPITGSPFSVGAVTRDMVFE